MLPQGSGSIINIASMSGHVVNIPQYQCAYNASKAGLIQLTRTLAVEWATRGVRVNSISPGYIQSDGLSAPELQPMVQEWLRMTPIGRIGTADELQAMCVYPGGRYQPDDHRVGFHDRRRIFLHLTVMGKENSQ